MSRCVDCSLDDKPIVGPWSLVVGLTINLGCEESERLVFAYRCWAALCYAMLPRNCRPNGRRCVALVFSIAYLLAIKFWIAKDGLATQKVAMTVLQDARQLRLERL
jgi:hypothetical protein